MKMHGEALMPMINSSIIDISSITTVLVALCGWFIVHRLTAWRDRVSHKRKISTDFLIKAYQNLANSSVRSPEAQYFRQMEEAIADIQLFGTVKQIKMIDDFLAEYQIHNKASMDQLLSSLRQDLRIELGYVQIAGNVKWFRPEGAPSGCT
jgi:hypothetical protein